MLCYKDKTFCTFYKDCIHGKTCPTALTPEVEKAGQEWSRFYGQEDLIARYLNPPQCHEMKPKRDENKYMRDYFKNNPLKNAWACHNGERVKKNYHKITFDEYLLYREFLPRRKDGKIKVCRGSRFIDDWEAHKEIKKLKFRKKV